MHLAPGAVRHVVFKLSPRDLSEVDAQGERVVLPGDYKLSIG
jgi:beta-glucosidase